MEFKPKKEFISKLLGDEGVSFVIPEYQRPYRWDIEECETLWSDIEEVFGDGENIDEYFLGSIVAHQNENGELEIIDGQQRITTLTLLFRAFYQHLSSEKANVKQSYLENFGKCIWEYDLDYGLRFDCCHLSSRIITEQDNEILKYVLNEVIELEQLHKMTSRYAKNFIFFYNKLSAFKSERALQWESFCKMFLQKKFFVLLVTCDSQESAMTIFNTLNSRGLPLSNADILKGYIYKQVENKLNFALQWKELETKVEENERIRDLDFLFLQYMHIIRAENKDSDATTQSILNFFTKKDKKVYYGFHGKWLYNDETIPFIKKLADFWVNPKSYLSEKSQKYMSILELFQNDSWKSFVSCIVWKNRNCIDNKELFSVDFDRYLVRLIQYITLPFLNNNVTTNIIKEIIFKMNVALIENSEFPNKQVMPSFEVFCDVSKRFDSRKVKYLLFVYAYIYDDFGTLLYASDLQVEHILPKKWQNANFNNWNEQTHREYLEQIGNKILLSKQSNIKCAENFFAKKKEEYLAAENQSLKEVQNLALSNKDNWIQQDIESRNKEIYEKLKKFVEA